MTLYRNPERGIYPANYIFLKGQLYTTSPEEHVFTVTHEVLAQRDKILNLFNQAAKEDKDGVIAGAYMVVGERITVYPPPIRKLRTLEFTPSQKAYKHAIEAFRQLSPGFEVVAG